MTRVTAVWLAIVLLPIPSFAWGPRGHRLVADLAHTRLTAAARREVVDLLGNDDLAAVSTWADEIRNQRPETYGWHFVDIPCNADGFSGPRDCYRPNEKSAAAREDHHNCVVDRIEIFRRILADTRAPKSDRVEALKFLIHFVGDLHQPLHAVGEARGGNDIHVSVFGSPACGGRPCNLHFVWDEALIDHAGQSEAQELADLERLISHRHLQREPIGTPEDWGNQSFRLAKQAWLNDGGSVDETYYERNIEMVKEQLARAGIRLAAVLNQTLGH